MPRARAEKLRPRSCNRRLGPHTTPQLAAPLVPHPDVQSDEDEIIPISESAGVEPDTSDMPDGLDGAPGPAGRHNHRPAQAESPTRRWAS